MSSACVEDVKNVPVPNLSVDYLKQIHQKLLIFLLFCQAGLRSRSDRSHLIFVNSMIPDEPTQFNRVGIFSVTFWCYLLSTDRCLLAAHKCGLSGYRFTKILKRDSNSFSRELSFAFSDFHILNLRLISNEHCFNINIKEIQ